MLLFSSFFEVIGNAAEVTKNRDGLGSIFDVLFVDPMFNQKNYQPFNSCTRIETPKLLSGFLSSDVSAISNR